MQLPHLEQRAAFEALAKDYQMSPQARTILAKTTIILMVSPTAVGKNTVISEVLKTGEYQFIVTDTTRPPRVNGGKLEENGVDYFFRSEDDMLADIRAGRFVEFAIIHERQVSGMSIREIEKALNAGKIAISDVDIHGVDSLVKAKSDAIAIFLLPPSFDAWLSRLKGRNPDMSDTELRSRFTSALTELRTALDKPYYRFVVNDDLSEAVKSVHDVAHAAGADTAVQIAARALAQQLLEATRAFLATK
jgi:guanylate kinase